MTKYSTVYHVLILTYSLSLANVMWKNLAQGHMVETGKWTNKTETHRRYQTHYLPASRSIKIFAYIF